MILIPSLYQVMVATRTASSDGVTTKQQGTCLLPLDFPTLNIELSVNTTLILATSKSGLIW